MTRTTQDQVAQKEKTEEIAEQGNATIEAGSSQSPEHKETDVTTTPVTEKTNGILTSLVVAPSAPQKAKATSALSQENKTVTSRVTTRRASTEAVGNKLESPKYASRVAEARACLNKAKLYLGNSRNLKTDIKTEVTQAIERLYQLVKEADAEKGSGNKPRKEQTVETKEHSTIEEKGKVDLDLIRSMEDHAKLIKENNEAMKVLTEVIQKQKETTERNTYACVAASGTRRWNQEAQATLHSVVVSSKDETETGEEVLTQIREAVNAKEGWVRSTGCAK